MTDTERTGSAEPHSGQKPRVVLMGEFSAGKSTLSNILLSPVLYRLGIRHQPH